MSQLTKEYIVKVLEEQPTKAVPRALVVLYNNQTEDEKRAETVRVHNGMGFKPCHGEIGTSMAKQFLQRGFLTEKQIAYWTKRDAKGKMRIACYWRQLLEAAQAKVKQKEEAV